jgi:alpha-tubulin suppressor-like RCC1 family protein
MIVPPGTLAQLDAGIATVDSFESAVVGRAHACGIVSMGVDGGARDVDCWGANDRGQSGTASLQSVAVPTPVDLSALGSVQKVAAGGDNTCAVITGGGVFCWGANDHGQLGDVVESGVTYSANPTRISVPTAKDIAVGVGHACALVTEGAHNAVWCWGDNSAGQLGTGSVSPTIRATPTPVLRVSGDAGQPLDLALVAQVSAGGQTTCATLLDGPNVWCWGSNSSGQAGQSPTDASVVTLATPVAW